MFFLHFLIFPRHMRTQTSIEYLRRVVPINKNTAVQKSNKMLKTHI